MRKQAASKSTTASKPKAARTKASPKTDPKPRAKPRAKPGPKTGTRVRASGEDGGKLVGCSDARWTDESEATFLAELAVTCNISRSAEKAEFSRAAVYKQRMNDPAFAAKWRAAVDQGYARIEALLLQRAEDSLAGVAIDPDSPIPAMTVQEATNILRLHRAEVKNGDNRAFRWRLQPADPQKARENILAKVAAVRRAKGYE